MQRWLPAVALSNQCPNLPKRQTLLSSRGVPQSKTHGAIRGIHLCLIWHFAKPKREQRQVKHALELLWLTEHACFSNRVGNLPGAEKLRPQTVVSKPPHIGNKATRAQVLPGSFLKPSTDQVAHRCILKPTSLRKCKVITICYRAWATMWYAFGVPITDFHYSLGLTSMQNLRKWITWTEICCGAWAPTLHGAWVTWTSIRCTASIWNRSANWPRSLPCVYKVRGRPP